MPARFDRDVLFLAVLRLAALVAGGIVLWIAGFLVVESVPALRTVGLARFLGDPSWHPAKGAAQGTFGMTAMLTGTLAATVGAMLLATPLGWASAIFVQGYAPPGLARYYRRLVELLAGIPSVVYGFWGLVVLVPLIRRIEPPGPSLLAGVLILALMILPTVALTADAALRGVESHHLRSAAALGLTRGATLVHVVFPAARAGLLGGVLLAAMRALGETMAILMVCGNIVQTPNSLFDPIRTLTANIALEMAYAVGDHRAALFVSGLALTAMVTVLVLLAERAMGLDSAKGLRHG